MNATVKVGNMRYRWLTSLALLLLVLACNADESSSDTGSSPTPSVTPSQTPQVLATRMAAEMIGILRDVGGCLRVGPSDDSSTLLVWPPDQHEVTRSGDTVRVVDFYDQPMKTVTWQIGEEVRLSGGGLQDLNVPHEELPPQCTQRPYWLVGGVD